MKTKFLILLLVVVSLPLGINVDAMELKTRQKIILKDNILSSSHRSMPILSAAFIDGSLLLVDFPFAVASVTVTVKNSATGEVAYSSVEILELPLTGILLTQCP